MRKVQIERGEPPFEVLYADGSTEELTTVDLDGGWRLVWDVDAKSPWAARGMNVHCWLEPK